HCVIPRAPSSTLFPYTTLFRSQVEYLYLAHTRLHEVLKTTIDGKVLWTIGWPQQAGIYEKEEQFNPTAIAVAPDGRIFVADGYRSEEHTSELQSRSDPVCRLRL